MKRRAFGALASRRREALGIVCEFENFFVDAASPPRSFGSKAISCVGWAYSPTVAFFETDEKFMPRWLGGRVRPPYKISASETRQQACSREEPFSWSRLRAAERSATFE